MSVLPCLVSYLVLSRTVLSCLVFDFVLSFVFRIGRFVRRRAELTKKVLAFSYYGLILSCLFVLSRFLLFFFGLVVLSYLALPDFCLVFSCRAVSSLLFSEVEREENGARVNQKGTKRNRITTMLKQWMLKHHSRLVSFLALSCLAL